MRRRAVDVGGLRPRRCHRDADVRVRGLAPLRREPTTRTRLRSTDQRSPPRHAGTGASPAKCLGGAPLAGARDERIARQRRHVGRRTSECPRRRSQSGDLVDWPSHDIRRRVACRARGRPVGLSSSASAKPETANRVAWPSRVVGGSERRRAACSGQAIRLSPDSAAAALRAFRRPPGVSDHARARGAARPRPRGSCSVVPTGNGGTGRTRQSALSAARAGSSLSVGTRIATSSPLSHTRSHSIPAATIDDLRSSAVRSRSP